jgi:putative ATP-dependent endonuclease of OLD family
MFLARVEIENFRGIRQLDLWLDQTTALIGENNSGKTSLLDALMIVLGGPGETLAFEPRDFHQPVRGAPPASQLRIGLTFRETAAREWTRPAMAPLVPAMTGRGIREIRLEVTARRDGRHGVVRGQWGFGGLRERRAGRCPPGLLAEVRRLSPILRLRSNRYIEEDPRQALHPRAAASPAASDPVVQQDEHQVRLVYERLRGRYEVDDAEIRAGLVAAREFLARHGGRLWRNGTVRRRAIQELADTPVLVGARGGTWLDTVKEGAGVRAIALIALLGALLDASGREPLPGEAEPLVAIEDAEAHLHPTALSALWSLLEALPAQKIATTNSGELLASVPLTSIRRLVRTADRVRVHRIDAAALTVEDRRRIAYHVRINRAGAMFARTWLLVEGETEAWLLPELARLHGLDFPAEGVRCIEYAQCGVRPLVRLATDLGIAWHLLADGDDAGRSYAAVARAMLAGAPERDHVTALEADDLERCLWDAGYAHIYRAAAGPVALRRREKPAAIIARAIHARSKPGLALEVVEAANVPGSPGVPPELGGVIDTVVRLARADSGAVGEAP